MGRKSLEDMYKTVLLDTSVQTGISQYKANLNNEDQFYIFYHSC